MKINEKNLSMFAVKQPFDLDGHLQKRGEVNRSWQRRYFVLKGNLLFYFERRGDREPLGLIVIEGCTIELSEDGEQYCFQIVFHGINNRTYYLSAESQTQMEQWMKALTCAGYEYTKLLVADLQRQLDEIDGPGPSTNGLAAQSLDIGSVPRPPPRRHNPFNGIAASGVPANLNKPSMGKAPNRVAPPVPLPPLLPPPRHNRLLVDSSASNGPTVDDLMSEELVNPFLAAADTFDLLSSGHSRPSLSAVGIPFDVIHEHFGRAIRRDLATHWDKCDPPLITF